jgi:Na+-driven multidrug efflux pump
MGTTESVGVRALFFQMLAHALIFAAQNASNLVERVLLASDTAACAALGLSGTAFCLLSAFTTNLVSVGQLVVGQRAGAGDALGARAAAGHALVLASGAGVLGLAIAGASLAAAVLATGPARHAALFLAAQGLALGPQLGTAAMTGYFIGTMRVGPGLVAALSALPIAVHLTFGWILTGILGWSLAGVGVARLAASAVAIMGVLAIARTDFHAIVESVRRLDRALLWKMVTEGSSLGLQQVFAGLMVLLLYFRAASGGGGVTSAALSLAHSGVYPLLFATAWGSSQAVGIAAALALGRGNGREFVHVAWLGLGLASGPALALPWGAYALYGRATLGRFVGGSPTASATLDISMQFMDALAIFFFCDFAINYLSALLRAAKEQAYLLKVTAAIAACFGLATVLLPRSPHVAGLMGPFIAAQAVWALLLLIRVIRRWPGASRRGLPAHRASGGRGPRQAVHAWVQKKASHRSTISPSWAMSAAERWPSHGTGACAQKAPVAKPIERLMSRANGSISIGKKCPQKRSKS